MSPCSPMGRSARSCALDRCGSSLSVENLRVENLRVENLSLPETFAARFARCERRALWLPKSGLLTFGRSLFATWLLVLGLSNLLGPGAASAQSQENAIPVRCHIWGPFDNGDWVRTSVDVEVYEAGVRVHRMQRVITRVLRHRDEKGYRLEVETLERTGLLSGDRERRRTATEDFPWFVDPDQLATDELVETELEWFGQTLKCRVFAYDVARDGRVVHHRDLFHADRFPYFLSRSAIRMSESRPDQVEQQEHSRVIENSVPIVLGDQIVSGVITRTTFESAERSVVVLEELAAEVPGGLVSKRVVELNDEGQVVRREVVSLIDFGDASDWEGGDSEGEESGSFRARGRLFRRWNRIHSDETEEQR